MNTTLTHLATWRSIFLSTMLSLAFCVEHHPLYAQHNEGQPLNVKGLTNYVQSIPGSTVKFEMVAIPGGEITVGSPENEPGRGKDELPPRKVKVKPFWMAKFEVSWQEFLPYVFVDRKEIVRDVDKLEGLVDADGVSHPTKPYGSVYRERGEKGFPALGMGVPAAIEYCRWISKKTGVNYRLPTEEEWEYACRAGSTNAYFWGNDPAKAKEYGWFKENAFDDNLQMESTRQMGRLKPNPFGLFDIVGNLAEWCAPVDTNAPHVVRGGAFTEPATQLRSAARMIETPEWNELDPQSPQSIWWLSAADFVGFRVVRSYDGSESAAAEADKTAPAKNDPSLSSSEKTAAATKIELNPVETASKTPAPAVVSAEATAANYKKHCAACHGADGRGDTKLGRMKKARDYTSPQVKASLDEEAMFKATKEGLMVDGHEVMMPYGKKLSDIEIRGLVRYMKSF